MSSLFKKQEKHLFAVCAFCGEAAYISYRDLRNNLYYDILVVWTLHRCPCTDAKTPHIIGYHELVRQYAHAWKDLLDLLYTEGSLQPLPAR